MATKTLSNEFMQRIADEGAWKEIEEVLVDEIGFPVVIIKDLLFLQNRISHFRYFRNPFFEECSKLR